MPASRSRSARYEAATARLRELYSRCGYLLVPNEARRRAETWQRYKKGYEIRFRALDISEAAEILRLLRVVGIGAGRPYMHLGRPVIPVYGESRVRQALRDLRLKRPPPEARKRRMAEPAKTHRKTSRWQGTAAIASMRQFDIAVLLDYRGPLAAGELNTTGSMLAQMKKRGLVAPIRADRQQPKRWLLTARGREATRRARRSYLNWMRASPMLGRPSAPPVVLTAASYVRPPSRLPADLDAADEIADSKQFKVAVLLCDKGPLTARELSATGALLRQLRRRGLVAALLGEGDRPRVGALTPKGIRETRRYRMVNRHRRRMKR